jgi:predicted nuclease of predicted toxin-antitoxin system
MRFLADMGVSDRVVRWLRSASHDVVHLRDRGLQRLPNGQIFLLAEQEQRVVLTFDLDFGEIVAGSGGKVVSVVLFRLVDARSERVIVRLQEVLLQATESLEQGAIVVVEEGRHRIRRLPIGS